jgi:hypothetical protein
MSSLEQTKQPVRLYKIGGFIVPVIHQNAAITSVNNYHITDRSQNSFQKEVPPTPSSKSQLDATKYTTTGTQYQNQPAYRHHDYDKFAREGSRLDSRNSKELAGIEEEPVFRKSTPKKLNKKTPSPDVEIKEDDDLYFELPKDKRSPPLVDKNEEAFKPNAVSTSRYLDDSIRRENTKRFERIEQYHKNKTTPKGSDGTLFAIRGTTKRVIEVTTTEVDEKTNKFMVMEPIRMHSSIDLAADKRAVRIRSNEVPKSQRKYQREKSMLAMQSEPEDEPENVDYKSKHIVLPTKEETEAKKTVSDDKLKDELKNENLIADQVENQNSIPEKKREDSEIKKEVAKVEDDKKKAKNVKKTKKPAAILKHSTEMEIESDEVVDELIIKRPKKQKLTRLNENNDDGDFCKRPIQRVARFKVVEDKNLVDDNLDEPCLPYFSTQDEQQKPKFMSKKRRDTLHEPRDSQIKSKNQPHTKVIVKNIEIQLNIE